MEHLELMGIKYPIKEIYSYKQRQHFAVSTDALNNAIMNNINKKGNYKNVETRYIDESTAYYVPEPIIIKKDAEIRNYIKDYIDSEF